MLNNAGRDDILNMSAPAMQLLFDNLKEAMSPWSDVPKEWTVPPLSVKVIRNYETWDLTGISFTMSRPISPSKVEGLDIEINCQTHPSGSKSDCEVSLWELSQLTIE